MVGAKLPENQSRLRAQQLRAVIPLHVKIVVLWNYRFVTARKHAQTRCR